MCGIAGLIHSKPENYIHRFSELIAHRGPDDHGVYIDGNLALAHRRLSIQDVSANGHQPMMSRDGRYVIIFNGEIYNHWDIRKKLEHKYRFKSTSDTETLLYGFAEYGEQILDKLNGIFAFAIYDRYDKELFIARDHLGVKPLYYYQVGHTFLFASEIKAMLAFPELDKTLEISNISDYLHFLYAPGSGTAFKHVRKLEPGYYLRINVSKPGECELKKYYEIPFNGEYRNQPLDKWVDELEEELYKAVERQLLSDVPLGFFLSGGLDSSLVVAMAGKAQPYNKPLCFTIDTNLGSKREGFSEDLPFAKKVAEHLRTELKIVKAKVDMLQDFDKMIWYLDEPQADAAPLNIYNISATAREMGIVVLLGGTGGDDLFSGYRRHQSIYYHQITSKLPTFLKRVLGKVSSNIPTGKPNFRRLIKFLSHFKFSDPNEQLASLYSWLPFNENLKLFNAINRETLNNYLPRHHLIDSLKNIPNESTLLNKMLYWELKYFLPDHNLNYTDKMSMAHGVEVRVPYLDKELVEYSTTIPPELKMKGTNTKFLLRKVAERYLPKEVVYRSKTGFGAPVRDWICGPLDAQLRTEFTPEKCSKRQIFDSDNVISLIERNKKNELDASYPIWGLLAIARWWEQFVDNSSIRH